MPRKRPRENEERWFVEAIIKARRTSHPGLPGKDFLHSPAWEYLIKWAGYGDDENSWEPVQGLSACKRLLLSFWEQVGTDSFLTRATGFEVEPNTEWIVQQKLNFAKVVSLEEVQAQIHNPKRRRTSVSRSPTRPSTPSNLRRSPRKVSFADVTDEVVIPSLAEVENTAQWHRASFSPIKQDTLAATDSDSDPEDDLPLTMISLKLAEEHCSQQRFQESSNAEDDLPNASTPNTTPTGLRIRIPRPTMAKSPTPVFVQEPPCTEHCEINPTLMAPSTASSFFSPPSTPAPHRTIKMYELPTLVSNSELATKKRLAKASVAPGIPRASPTLSPTRTPTVGVDSSDNAIEVDPTFDPDPNANDNVNTNPGESSPLASMFVNEDVHSFGGSFYTSDEDRYAGLRTNDLIEQDIGGTSENIVDDYLNPVSVHEAEQFLSTVELTTPASSTSDYRPTRPLHEPAPFQKWAWHGRLAVPAVVQIDPDETICETVTITDATDCNYPRIASYLPSDRALQLTAVYDLDDLLMFLGICEAPRQFARVTANDDDADRLQIFARYLETTSQVVVLPTLYEGRLHGVLLFFPPTCQNLLQILQPPGDLRQNAGLLVALLCTHESPAQQRYKKKAAMELECTVERAVLSREEWHKSLQHERDYHISLRILQLPVWVREYVYRHASTIWHKSTYGPGRRDEIDQETGHLLQVLKKSKLRVVKPNDETADVIFIHVGALENLHNIPLLAQRRLRPKFRFFLYGTHETVPPCQWGFRDVYSLGGVVTFTPEALASDPWGVLKTVHQIHAHPLWDCYIMPQILGMAVQLTGSGARDDEMPEYTGTLPYLLNKICEAILQGKISLTTAPHSKKDEDTRQWVLDNSLLKPQTITAILEHCNAAFQTVYAPHAQSSWSTFTKNDISQDLRRMQIQPAAYTSYRRFVVLDSNLNLPYDSSDGLEWKTLGKFDFQDDFIGAFNQLSMVDKELIDGELDEIYATT
ncbi:hypothetical protein R3P38DRAFT_3169079 [Favolaschia claudopus]|uniref:Chromo domain-containing protein n=1 Tax=Favolaschia claudopus TaxID=2862362 RepID=A0AAW0E1A8_9AGAR